MNVNDPLFTDLALKVFAGRASEAERSELAARVASHPEFEAELESLQADVAFAKEVLPLLGDEHVKAAELPGYARVRLRAAVILVSLNWPCLIGNTARNVNSKPLVQLAMLDSMGQTRSTAASGFLKNSTLGVAQENLNLAATLKESLQQTEQRFPVGNERDLSAVLREVVAAFGQTALSTGGIK